MTSIGTYWRTARHLKARQVVGRLVFRLGALKPQLRSAPALRGPVGRLVEPARREQSLFPGPRFRFLNEEHALQECGWDSSTIPRLWRYNLHYFDDLNAHDRELRRDLHSQVIDRWIAENPPVSGSGWEPYPTSLRVVNWIKWFCSGVPPRDPWISSLATQVRWLEKRLEWHLLGNHLFANAKALFIAGLYFDGEEAERWRSRGARILLRELHEQVLGDGGHFERSPMYHRLALEDVLDALAFLNRYGTPDSAASRLHELLAECSARMRDWARFMRFSDGSMPRFNDSAEGIAPSYEEICRVADALGIAPPLRAEGAISLLASSGYARMVWSEALAFVDVARIGPDYLPGHAHADTLSFELEIQGRLVVVNRGTSCYGDSPRRHYERSTLAHSTVQVGSGSSSETWGGFRVGRRAYPIQLEVQQDRIACSHDGYRYLSSRPIHRRAWIASARGLEVKDEVTGGTESIARYHLAPGLLAQEVSSDRWIILDGDRVMANLEVDKGACRVVPGEQAIAFGVLAPAQTLEIKLTGGQCSTRWSW